MGLEHRLRKAETAERYFRCARCGARGEVAFVAEGDSGWQADDLLVEDGQLRALSAADEALMHDAERTLGLVRCPTCGERDRATVRWAQLRVAAWLGAGAGLALYVGPAAWLSLAGFAVGGGLQLWRELARVRRADHAHIVKHTPGTLPAPARKALPPPPPPPARVAPPIPVARAITAPPPRPQVAPPKPRSADEDPAFLRDPDDL